MTSALLVSLAELVISSSPLAPSISQPSFQLSGPVARKDGGQCTSKDVQEGTSVCVLFCLHLPFPYPGARKKKQVWEVQGPEASLSQELESRQEQKGCLEWPGENLGKESDIILLFRDGGLSSGNPVW